MICNNLYIYSLVIKIVKFFLHIKKLFGNFVFSNGDSKIKEYYGTEKYSNDSIRLSLR